MASTLRSDLRNFIFSAGVATLSLFGAQRAEAQQKSAPDTTVQEQKIAGKKTGEEGRLLREVVGENVVSEKLFLTDGARNLYIGVDHQAVKNKNSQNPSNVIRLTDTKNPGQSWELIRASNAEMNDPQIREQLGDYMDNVAAKAQVEGTKAAIDAVDGQYGDAVRKLNAQETRNRQFQEQQSDMEEYARTHFVPGQILKDSKHWEVHEISNPDADGAYTVSYIHRSERDRLYGTGSSYQHRLEQYRQQEAEAKGTARAINPPVLFQKTLLSKNGEQKLSDDVLQESFVIHKNGLEYRIDLANDLNGKDFASYTRSGQPAPGGLMQQTAPEKKKDADSSDVPSAFNQKAFKHVAIIAREDAEKVKEAELELMYTYSRPLQPWRENVASRLALHKMTTHLKPLTRDEQFMAADTTKKSEMGYRFERIEQKLPTEFSVIYTDQNSAQDGIKHILSETIQHIAVPNNDGPQLVRPSTNSGTRVSTRSRRVTPRTSSIDIQHNKAPTGRWKDQLTLHTRELALVNGQEVVVLGQDYLKPRAYTVSKKIDTTDPVGGTAEASYYQAVPKGKDKDFARREESRLDLIQGNMLLADQDKRREMMEKIRTGELKPTGAVKGKASAVFMPYR